MARLRALVDLGQRTYASWRADRTLRLGAGLAYYALFTFVPFLAITAALLEPLVGRADIAAFLTTAFSSFGFDDPEMLAANVTDGLTRDRNQTSLGLVGGVSLLFSASIVFIALDDAVNAIWQVPVQSGWVNTVRRRLTGFAMVLISCSAIVLSLAMNAVLGAAKRLVPGNVGILESLAPAIGTVASGAGLAAVLVLLFRYGSPRSLPWRGTAVIAALTTILLMVSTVLTGWYLREFGGRSLAGAFGAVFALLTWVYVEAQIILAAVQLTKAAFPVDATPRDTGDVADPRDGRPADTLDTPTISPPGSRA